MTVHPLEALFTLFIVGLLGYGIGWYRASKLGHKRTQDALQYYSEVRSSYERNGTRSDNP